MIFDARISAIIICLLALPMVGCATPKYSKNWHLIQKGMTKAEVKEILGEPDAIKSAFRYRDDADPFEKAFVNAMFDGWHEKWYYGKKSGILSSIIPFYPSKSHMIYFDDNDRVVGFWAPAEGDDAG